MNVNKRKKENRGMRHKRVRSKAKGTSNRPRLSVFRSSKHIVLQLIDDEKGVTIASAGDVKSSKVSAKLTKKERAKNIGKELAKNAVGKKIKKVVFDRGGYLYHGRVKEAADGAREGGLKF